MSPKDPLEPTPDPSEPHVDPLEPRIDPIEMHEQQIRDLAAMHRDEPSVVSHEQLLDRADAAYAVAHDAGLMRDRQGEDEPFVWPSVRREQIYQERIRETPRPATILTMTALSGVSHAYDPNQSKRMRTLTDPREGLKGQSYPAAILEEVSDNDPLDGSYTMTWLGCRTVNEAVAYGEEVGWSHSKPGPGEDDGVYTTRTLFDNPYFLATKNGRQGEVDPELVEQEIFKLMRTFNLDPSTQQAEMDLAQDLLFVVVSTGRQVAEDMLGIESEGNRAKAYLNPKTRDRRFKDAHQALLRDFDKMDAALREIVHHDSAKDFAIDDKELIRKAAVKLSDTLQARYELTDVTRDAFELILGKTLQLAELRLSGRNNFVDQGASEGEKKWDQEVDKTLHESRATLAADYKGPLDRYLKEDFWIL